MLFAFQDSSRQVRALFTLMFAFQGKRFNPKGCKGVYAGWQKDAFKIGAAEPASPCAAQYRGISDKLGRAALGPISLASCSAKVRQRSRLLAPAATTTLAPAHSAEIACALILHHHCRRSRKGTRRQNDLSVEESHANLETAATFLPGPL